MEKRNDSSSDWNELMKSVNQFELYQQTLTVPTIYGQLAEFAQSDQNQKQSSISHGKQHRR